MSPEAIRTEDTRVAEGQKAALLKRALRVICAAAILTAGSWLISFVVATA
ncbi:hypothetical protein ABID21_003812 [Pseudorhizobium tarimense]|uniref:Uncharacterized protein n=1 Tax=Pseudorhizobium tarimense TaxID=1079109 RepID=A0ABV2HAW3_9HYPH|nr:hypothetical protein [Pseudorhizobium tarimense]MCJ8520777.1 hypothetical protein [Pseudorhizobium tarimense]